MSQQEIITLVHGKKTKKQKKRKKRKKERKGRICQFTIHCQVDAKVRLGELIHERKCGTCQPWLVVFPAVFNCRSGDPCLCKGQRAVTQ